MEACEVTGKPPGQGTGTTLVTGLAQVDITRMRDQLFFDGPERPRRLSRFWLLLLRRSTGEMPAHQTFYQPSRS